MDKQKAIISCQLSGRHDIARPLTFFSLSATMLSESRESGVIIHERECVRFCAGIWDDDLGLRFLTLWGYEH